MVTVSNLEASRFFRSLDGDQTAGFDQSAHGEELGLVDLVHPVSYTDSTITLVKLQRNKIICEYTT